MFSSVRRMWERKPLRDVVRIFTSGALLAQQTCAVPSLVESLFWRCCLILCAAFNVPLHTSSARIARRKLNKSWRVENCPQGFRLRSCLIYGATRSLKWLMPFAELLHPRECLQPPHQPSLSAPPHKVIPTTFSPMNFSSVIGFSMKSKSTSTQTDEKPKCIFPFPLSKEFFIMKNPSNIQQQFFLFCFSFCRWFLFRLTDDSMGKKATKWSDMTARWWIFQHWQEWKIDTLLKEGRV